jgi:hypothetical protein
VTRCHLGPSTLKLHILVYQLFKSFTVGPISPHQHQAMTWHADWISPPLSSYSSLHMVFGWSISSSRLWHVMSHTCFLPLIRAGLLHASQLALPDTTLPPLAARIPPPCSSRLTSLPPRPYAGTTTAIRSSKSR